MRSNLKLIKLVCMKLMYKMIKKIFSSIHDECTKFYEDVQN